MEKIQVDVLVCGAGMSGMACAAFAAEAGAKVLVVEKQGDVGGSSNYSAGMLYVIESIFKSNEIVNTYCQRTAGPHRHITN